MSLAQNELRDALSVLEKEGKAGITATQLSHSPVSAASLRTVFQLRPVLRVPSFLSIAAFVNFDVMTPAG